MGYVRDIGQSITERWSVIGGKQDDLTCYYVRSFETGSLSMTLDREFKNAGDPRAEPVPLPAEFGIFPV